MKVVASPRGTGKTTEAILESAKTGKYIVTVNKKQTKMVADMAKKLKLNIPFPITLDEILRGTGPLVKEVIVDEAGLILEQIINKKITMLTATSEDCDKLMEPKYHWWKPRKQKHGHPTTWRATVYGIIATDQYLEPNEIDRLDYIYLGHMTREEMLELTGIAVR